MIAVVWMAAAPTLCRAGVLGGCCESETARGTESAGCDGCPQPEPDCANCADVCRASFRPSEETTYQPDQGQPCDVVRTLQTAPALPSFEAAAYERFTPDGNPSCHASDLPLLI